MSPAATSDRVLARRLLRQARVRWRGLLLLLGVSLLAVPLALLMPLPLKVVVDSALGEQPLPAWLAWLAPAAWEAEFEGLLYFAGALALAVALLAQLQEMATWAIKTAVGERLVADLRGRLFGHLQRLSLSRHDARGTADALYRVQVDAAAIQAFVVEGLLPLGVAAVRILVLFIATARIDASLAIVAALGAPLLYLLTHLSRARLRRRWTAAKEAEARALGVVQEALSALRVVKAFGQETREQERYEQDARATLRAQVRAVLSHGSFDVLAGLVVGLGASVILGLGAMHVREGAISVGDLLVALGYLGLLFQPLREVGTKAADLQRALSGAARVFSVLDEPAEVAVRPGARHVDRVRGEVEFEGVTFGYTGQRVILREASFRIPAGARVGISGPSGSGKSTLLGLLLRLYDPQEGVIRLDGVDARDLRLEDLRRQMTIVLQEPVLFSTTIGDNIAYGLPGASEAQIQAAARAAGAHDFISRLPQQYDTPVGERGARLSGGERQRVSIARALLKDAPIVLLDEPTSSIDVATEQLILSALQRLMQDRTTFLIAHRAETLAGCDHLLVFDQGRLTLRKN